MKDDGRNYDYVMDGSQVVRRNLLVDGVIMKVVDGGIQPESLRAVDGVVQAETMKVEMVAEEVNENFINDRKPITISEHSSQPNGVIIDNIPSNRQPVCRRHVAADISNVQTNNDIVTQLEDLLMGKNEGITMIATHACPICEEVFPKKSKKFKKHFEDHFGGAGDMPTIKMQIERVTPKLGLVQMKAGSI